MPSLPQLLGVSSFTFDAYTLDTKHSVVSFTYSVTFKFGVTKIFTDQLYFPDVPPELWDAVPKSVLEPTLQALLLILGINYWSVFRTRNINIKGFSLTREQAKFWDTLYLNGLAEFFYANKIDFHDLIAFPYDDTITLPPPTQLTLPARSLLLNGAGKDSILSAEMLKTSKTDFDFFAFAPTPAHERIAKLVGAKSVRVIRRRDPWMFLSGAYPSVSMFTFISVLLAEVLGYDAIVFSNERSADFGNLTYLDLPVNHQWCKSSEAEKLINDYIRSCITPSISTHSLLRQYSELEIVQRFAAYPQYFYDVTSCNTYFWEPRLVQRLSRTNYWCNRCPKCVFLFACFSAFLPKKELVNIFGADLYNRRRLLPIFRRLLGIKGFKPLDCVGEPEEMILAMHLAARRNEYTDEPAMRLFEKNFPREYDFGRLEQKIFADQKIII